MSRLAWAPLLLFVACGGGADESDPVDAGPEVSIPDSPHGGLPGTGSACIPPDENQREFPGASLVEVSIVGTDGCASGLCLVNHFQGRVTCPFGQDPEDVATLPPSDPARCRLPYLPGDTADQAVSVAVPPQFMGRPPDDAVYCSCLCAGPDPSATYCTCDAGFDCVDVMGLPATSPYAGSLCIKSGTAYDAAASYGAPCGSGPPDAGSECGDRNP